MIAWLLGWALLSPLTFAIGWCCGRRSDIERTAHVTLLRMRGERIVELEARNQILEQSQNAMVRAVERLRGMG